MFEEDYDKICEIIITQTMSLIKAENMKRYSNINKNDITNGDIIYKSAAAGKASITIVDTPAGTGKSMLIKDRVNCLLKQNVAPDKIMILNLNIAKSKQMIKEFPKGLQIMTFCEFTHNMFRANCSDIEVSSEQALLNAIRLIKTNPTEQAFIQRLSMRDPKERNTMLSLFVNQHTDETYDLLKKTNKISYMLEALICQNKMYKFKKDPYDVDVIIINGVHNMPVPILCSVIEYANKRKANLFITGTNDETIYDFNMAYANTMNVLASFASKNIEIIRLTQSKMHKDIKDTMDMRRSYGLRNVKAKNIVYKDGDDEYALIDSAFSDNIINYINARMQAKEQILILARSNADIHKIKQIIESKCQMENKTTIDLTEFQIPKTTYGDILSKYQSSIIQKFPKMTCQKMKTALIAVYDYEINKTLSQRQRAIYTNDKENIDSFIDTIFSFLPDKNAKYDAMFLIKGIVEYENKQWKKYMKKAESTDPPDFSSANIIYSTIHSAIDIRSDHTIILFHDINEEKNKSLYHVALSRANISEYIIFLNNNKYPSQYYAYIKNNTRK